MQNSELIGAFLVLALTNVGALIYFVGSTSSTVKNHGERIEVLETSDRDKALAIGELKGRLEARQ